MERKNNKRKKMDSLLYSEVAIVIFVIFLISAIVGIIIYYQISSSRVYIENSDIEAPVISLSATSPGILKRVFVKEGQRVLINSIVARVGNNSIKTITSGIVIYTKNTPGQFVTSRDALVKIINPQELRVVGHVEEDKGLKYIKIGQKVIFTVDAFGSKEYKGFVEGISPSAHRSDIVFSISDKREERRFDIKVKFNPSEYPELKNGMSARMWIYK